MGSGFQGISFLQADERVSQRLFRELSEFQPLEKPKQARATNPTSTASTPTARLKRSPTQQVPRERLHADIQHTKSSQTVLRWRTTGRSNPNPKNVPSHTSRAVQKKTSRAVFAVSQAAVQTEDTPLQNSLGGPPELPQNELPAPTEETTEKPTPAFRESQLDVPNEVPDPFDDPFGEEAENNSTDLSPKRGFEPTPNSDNNLDSEFEKLTPPGNPQTGAFNKRDCDADREACLQDLAVLKANTIDQISLDITPRFRPDEESPATAAVKKSQQLDKSPSREWRGKHGVSLAQGRMTDYRNGRVDILQGNGTTVQLKYRELDAVDRCFVAAWWGVPSECNFDNEHFTSRDWIASTLTWKAASTCHKPLYFEEVQLERYGHSAGPLIQPSLSAAHFFGNLVALPYKMGIHPPNECRYSLGYYRPGSCAPWLVPPVPLSLRAALLPTAAAIGGGILIP